MDGRAKEGEIGKKGKKKLGQGDAGAIPHCEVVRMVLTDKQIDVASTEKFLARQLVRSNFVIGLLFAVRVMSSTRYLS